MQNAGDADIAACCLSRPRCLIQLGPQGSRCQRRVQGKRQLAETAMTTTVLGLGPRSTAWSGMAWSQHNKVLQYGEMPAALLAQVQAWLHQGFGVQSSGARVQGSGFRI